jgi:CBS domain-containing protein
MNNPLQTPAANRLILWAETAADMMMPNPVSLPGAATVAEALALLTDRGFSAAPVMDEAGRPIGVLSRTDILVHEREQLILQPGATPGVPKDARVRDLMTPVVFSVSPEATAQKVIQEMLSLKVHRLFVVDSAGVLTGVITAEDVLRHLRPAGTEK